MALSMSDMLAQSPRHMLSSLPLDALPFAKGENPSKVLIGMPDTLPKPLDRKRHPGLL